MTERRSTTILMDMDGVLADMETPFAEQVRAVAPHIDFPFLKNNHSWDMSHGLDEEGVQVLESVMTAPGFFYGFEPYPYAFETLAEMEDEGFDVRICTSPKAGNPTCANDKIAWLDEGDPTRSWGNKVIITGDKTMVRGNYLFDDKDKITGLYQPTWSHVIVDRTYNRDTPPNDTRTRITDLRNWREHINEY